MIVEELSRSASPKRRSRAVFGDNAATTAVCRLIAVWSAFAGECLCVNRRMKTGFR